MQQSDNHPRKFDIIRKLFDEETHHEKED